MNKILYLDNCIKYNLFITSQNNYKLNKNDNVKVVNINDKMKKKRTILNKDNYKVIDKVGNIYKLKNTTTNNVLFKPRFEIKKF